MLGKPSYIICRHNADLEEIPIQNEYFLLVVLMSGKLDFCEGGSSFLAEAPCCICFNEKENPKLERAEDADYFCIYFRPEILDADLTFDFLQNCCYKDVAHTHEMFLLSPFWEDCLKGPIEGETFHAVWEASENLYEEMEKERDLHWYYRCRSWFMEILIGLERMAKFPKRLSSVEVTAGYISDKRLRAAVIYIERNYNKKIELKDVGASCGLNHTTLTALFKREMKMTIAEYIMYCRIKAARKLLRSTELSVKEIAADCGFKTEAHFCRVFKEYQNETPGEFRRRKMRKSG